jgi:light-regulated signal transduction histidine kinase (bacteriophytochrome)
LHIPRKTPSLRVSADAVIFSEGGLQVAVVENGAVQCNRRHRSVTDDHHRAVAPGRDRKQPPLGRLRRRCPAGHAARGGDIYEPIAENKSIALHVEAPDPLSVRGDRDLLIEAVANLVDNAVKFTPEGGRVDMGVSRSGDGTVVSVTDSGPGIIEREREAVLRRFYRSDKIRNAPGVGLGLSLVAAIAKLHGFRLKVQPGPGCKVEIACPDRRD